tara:strand:+ start:2904 stop:3503 length:600 start_codon:yes stop_codon:yes gene_type:complete
MRARLALVLAMLCFSTSLLSGCIGLVASRELMELNRGVPEIDNQMVQYKIENTFDSTEIEAIIFNPEPLIIKIDSEVSEMKVLFRVEIPYSTLAGVDISNFTSEVRYVHARLWEPGANKNTDSPFWEDNATKTYYPQPKKFYPPFEEGAWELEVEAQGYGWTSPVDQLSFHDNFEVSVTLTSPCTIFPESADTGECTPI